MLDRIGSGGMGIVWKAKDERLQPLVAVKQLRLAPELSPRDTDEARARALREARIAARLHHPNAIVVYDVAEHEGEPCIVMEYLPSSSLAATLGERYCLPAPEVASIGRQIASALAAAHDAQIVHRDVKPGNILITTNGTAKITDFGVSRAVGDVTVTQTGMMAGTPAFLAPEVARGQLPTAASDVFSLGATLYAALEGHGPFGESDNPLALLHAVANGQLIPPQHAGPFASVLMALLAVDPTARPDMHRASLELAAASNAPEKPRTASTRPANPPRPATQVTRRLGLGKEPEPQAPGPETGPPKPPWARPEAAPARPPRRVSRTGMLVAVVVVTMLAVIGIGGLVWRGASTDQAQSAGVGRPQPSAVTPTPPPEPIPSPQPQRADHAIAWSDAGQRVIDYYNGLDSPSTAWAMLSPTAQATFGTESDFRVYWSRFTSVSARNASGVTNNPDGSVRVPVDVTYQQATGSQVIKRALRVAWLGGRLLIDSDPR